MDMNQQTSPSLPTAPVAEGAPDRKAAGTLLLLLVDGVTLLCSVAGLICSIHFVLTVLC